MSSLEEALLNIEPLDKGAMEWAQVRLDSLTKPLGSLGRLEFFVKQLAGISRSGFPCVENKKIIIMCADNGIVDEGVSSCPKSVTSAVTQNFTKGITGVNVLARHAGAFLEVIDIGVDDEICCDGVINKKIRKGTWNMAKGPAMTREEAIRAIEVGIEAVKKLKDEGVNLLGTGEMGIGNTSTSTAITAVLTGMPVEVVTGRGSGLTDIALLNKIDTIKKVIEVNKPNQKDPLDVLSKVGGFDIAGLVGCFIGAATYRLPILLDGFISAAAALVAYEIDKRVADFILPSHGSEEPGSEIILKHIDKEPILNLGMRLGEGSGAAIAFHIIDAAIISYTQMGTFGDAKIEQYVPQI